MAASREEISCYFDAGVRNHATHMLMVCDLFDDDDFPVYVYPGAAVQDLYQRYERDQGRRVMEVYDLGGEQPR